MYEVEPASQTDPGPPQKRTGIDDSHDFAQCIPCCRTEGGVTVQAAFWASVEDTQETFLSREEQLSLVVHNNEAKEGD